MNPYRDATYKLVLGGLCLLALAWLLARGCGKAEGATVANQLALEKCRLLVRECYPNSGFEPWCGTLISEHERRGAGFVAEWWWSLVYGGSNFALRVGAVAPGNCAGPMDVKRFPRLTEPGANIRYHCAEMWGFYRQGVRGRDLCEHVFLPSNPRDWGGGRFRRTDARHRAVIAKAYREGRLDAH